MYELLKKRSKIIKQIRNFFDNKNYIEVDTPILAKKTIPESSIQLMHAYGQILGQKKQKYYLLPSPEYYIKQLISNGFDQNIYQISKCFRNQEVQSNQHLLEFSMLEFYTLNFDYKDSLNLTKELFDFLDIKQKIIELDIFYAFSEYLKIDLKNICLCQNPLEALKKASKDIIIHSESDTFSDIFDKIILTNIDPLIRKESDFVALINYPCIMQSLAKKDFVKTQRWELFFKGIEICNCYSEETDFFRINEYFKKEKKLIKNKSYDSLYPKKIANMKKVSGNAIGLDRLIMCILEVNNIKDITYNQI